MKFAVVNPNALTQRAKSLFDPKVCEIIYQIHKQLAPDRKLRLAERSERQAKYNKGESPTFLKNHPGSTTQWKVATLPEDILERRVEITGPVNSAKMVIQMLSAGPDGVVADMAMLDFEDSMKPTWENVVDGVHNVIGAARGDLTFTREATPTEPAKIYRLDPENMAHVMVRIRGLHLAESNITVDGEPVSGGMVDLILCAYHAAKILLSQKKTPMFYVPKCEHFLEAKWWHQLFTMVEEKMDLPFGALRTTFLIETLPAAFQMEEILYEIRERAAGLNGGRWDKIFSDIKVFRYHKDKIMADRSTIDMSRPWMDNYAKRLIKICHKHGAFAMGGMSAFTPGKDGKTRELQTQKVLQDKGREASIGHDGCWVSHPYFTASARAQFKKKNQLDVLLEDFDLYPDLIPSSEGPKTLKGLRTNIRVAIAYTHGWAQGLGCVAFDNLMEDLATLEISRAQTWQWLHHKVKLDEGLVVDQALVLKLFDEECAKIVEEFRVEAALEKSDERFGKLKSALESAKETAAEVFTQNELADFFSMASDLEH